MKKLILVTGALMMLIAVSGVTAWAEAGMEQYVELLRSDFKTQKVAIVTEAMQMSDAESEAFWPVYREYDHELTSLGDMRIALIKDYAKNYDTMTDEVAKELIKRVFKLDDKRLSLDKKYYKKIAKATTEITAFKFFQVQNQIDLIVGLQVSSELPLIQRAE